METIFKTIGEAAPEDAAAIYSNENLNKLEQKETKTELPAPQLPNERVQPPQVLSPTLEPAAITTPPPAATSVAEQIKEKISESGTGIQKATKQMMPKPTEGMHLSDIQIIKKHEGFRESPYHDSHGIAIGYGTRIDNKPELLAIYGTPENPKKKITKTEAETLLKKKVSEVENAIYRNVKVPVPQGMFDSLVDFGYNLGENVLQEKQEKGVGSTLITKLNKGDYKGATKEFEKWDKSQGKSLPGLKSRRIEEMERSRASLETFTPSSPEILKEPPQRGEKIAAISTENALATVGNSGGNTAPVVIAPKTNISSSQTSMMLPVNVNNDEDTHTWATRQNYNPV